MTFGQLFTAMHPDVRTIENGSCVWLFMDEANHYTIANEWWNQEITGYALELLKEQEPRVLTWDEVKRAEVCWVEERGKEPYAALDAADWNPEYYGKTIRCWNYKPTKEQMEAVKWE